MALFNSKPLTQALIPHAALALYVILAMANNALSQKTSFTYDFNGTKPTTLTYQGDAHFPSDSTNLRLTRTDSTGTPLQNSVGRVIYSNPIQFWDTDAQVDLETTIKFTVKPKANDNNPADGIVFFIAPVGTTIPDGSVGGNFGIFGTSGNTSSIFAVEFDVYINGEWDAAFRHIGIDVESRKSLNVTQISDSLIGDEVTLRVDYEEATRIISAVVTTNSHRYEVSYVYDLSSVLPQQVQVGIAASTGENVAVHDIIAWYFTATLVHPDTNGKDQGAYIREVA